MTAHPGYWVLCSGLFVGALVSAGCSNARFAESQAVYVDLESLTIRHPVARSLRVVPVHPGVVRTPDLPAVRPWLERPPLLKPLVLVDAVEKARGRSNSDLQGRISKLEARAASRVARDLEQQFRADAAAVRAERDAAMADAGEAVRTAAALLSEQARRRTRALDLQLVGLETQVGSIAAGPQTDVMERIRQVRAEKAAVAARLAQQITRVQSEQLQMARDRVEAVENERASRRESAMRAAKLELGRAVRQYQAAMGDPRREIPGMHIPTAEYTARSAGAVAMVGAGANEITERPRYSSAGENRLLALVRDDTLRVARRLARERGWVLTMRRKNGIPDRTAEVGQMLERFWSAD